MTHSKEKLTALATILRKEVARFLRIWTQTLLPPVITQSLYFIIFGTFIGSRIGLMEGLPYMAFIVPGLVMMAVINGSFSNVVASFFGSKFMRNIDELLVAPVPPWIIIAGYVGGGVLRAILVGLLVFGVSVFFTAPEVHNFGVIMLFMVLTAILFGLGGMINAIYAKKFDDITIFTVFVLTPLTYLGGVFYSINSLPTFWQNVSKLNPILYMVDGFRYGFYGVSFLNVWYSLGMLAVFVVIVYAVTLMLIRRGVGLKK